MVLFNQRQGKVHSGRHAGGRIDIFVTNKYWIRIDVCARRTSDQNLTPVPVCCGPTAVEQTGARQQHGAGADGPDSPNSSSDNFQPVDYFGAYFVILNRAAARYQQGVDVSTQLAESFVRHDSHVAVRDKGAVRGSGHDFDGIDW